MLTRSFPSLSMLIGVALLLANGCSRPELTLQGGTDGTVSINGKVVTDLQINVFADDKVSPRRVAFGVSDANGYFSLIDDDGQGSVSLPPGNYRLTIESVAADPIPFNPIYGSVKSTPLLKKWSSSDDELVVELK